MASILILHVSDLHLHDGNDIDAKIVIDCLLVDVTRVMGEENLRPDLLIFSGDLVNAGTSQAEFAKAKSALIDPLLAACGLSLDRFAIVPGNHDIDRAKVRAKTYIDLGIKQALTTVDKLNTFIDQNAEAAIDTSEFERLKEYNIFAQSIEAKKLITNNNFLRTSLVPINDQTVGIACFNTSWLTTGEKDSIDRRKILLGERNVDNALRDLASADVRVAVLHHPLDWLADFDRIAVASRLYAGFDIVLSGHIHQSEPTHTISPQGGSVFCQAGCIFEKRDHFNGYQFIKYDAELGELELIIRSYQNIPRRAFDAAVNVAAGGRIKFAVKKNFALDLNGSIEGLLRELRPVIRSNAAEHINIQEAGSELSLDATKAFICPPLNKRKSSTDTNEQELASPDDISAEYILRNEKNWTAFGVREAGKSSLAHYLAVLCSEGCSDKQRIPVVIDFRTLNIAISGLRKSTASYFGTIRQGMHFDNLLQSGAFLLLIDNFSGVDKKRKKQLVELIEKTKQNRWILFSDNRLGGLDPDADDSDVIAGFELVHIKALPRKSIRTLTNRWCELTGKDKQKTYTAVMDQLQRSSLPRTGYIVTLLLWAMYQEKQMERVNEAVLLTNMSDYLLGKADFTMALRREFDPRSKEITLQEIARALRLSGGVMSGNDLTKHLLSFFERKRLAYDTGEVQKKFFDCGILAKKDDLVSFKYRTFQDFYYACYLRENQEVQSEIIESGNLLDYAHEIDLLSGLERQSIHILRKLSDMLETRAPLECNSIEFGEFEVVTKAESAVGVPRSKLEDIKRKRLTSEQIDDLLDVADQRFGTRHAHSVDKDSEKADEKGHDVIKEDISEKPASVAKYNGPGIMSPGLYLETVDLFGRVIRNCEFIDATDKHRATKAYLLQITRTFVIWSKVFAEIIDHFGGAGKTPILDETERKVARYTVNRFSLLTVTEMSNEQIATEKITGILDDIYQDPLCSFAEKVLIVFMMFDLGHKSWLAYWRQLADLSRGNRLVLEVMIDKAWGRIHTRPITEREREQICEAVEYVERHLGMTKTQKPFLLKVIRDTVKAEQRKDEQLDE